ncbi:retrovirus-related pol polyprotein from transposon TNT 1-94 [Tanacetum coccineum]
MLENQRLHNDIKGLGFADHKASTSEVKMSKTSKSVVRSTSDVPDQADPCERDPASVSEGIRASVIADTKLKPFMQSRTNFVQITKKTSPSATVGNIKQPPALKLGQGLAKACNIGKQVHVSHKAKNMVSTTKCLELLHMDLFGLSAIQSYGGNFYTLVIVEDYSRYTWTRFLKNKNEAFDHFEILSKKIQVQKGCPIVSIRTDHGREFDNEVQFGAFCDANGINHNFSAPRTPQSNGIVEVSRNKARLVAQGYNQQERIDFDETCAPIERLESIRILLAYAYANDFNLFQMDVKSDFLNGFINEEVYISQPPSFVDFEKLNHVYKLKKALYGLKQAPNAW